jgi:hypothetical protein
MAGINLGQTAHVVDLMRDRQNLLVTQAQMQQRERLARQQNLQQQQAQTMAFIGQMMRQRAQQQQMQTELAARDQRLRDSWAFDEYGTSYNQFMAGYENARRQNPDLSVQDYGAQIRGRAKAAEYTELNQLTTEQGFYPSNLPRIPGSQDQQLLDWNKITMRELNEPVTISAQKAQEFGVSLGEYVQIASGNDPFRVIGYSPEQITLYNQLTQRIAETQVGVDADTQANGMQDRNHYLQQRAKIKPQIMMRPEKIDVAKAFDDKTAWVEDKNNPGTYMLGAINDDGNPMIVRNSTNEKADKGGGLLYGGYSTEAERNKHADKLYETFIENGERDENDKFKPISPEEAMRKVDEEIKRRDDMAKKFRERDQLRKFQQAVPGSVGFSPGGTPQAPPQPPGVTPEKRPIMDRLFGRTGGGNRSQIPPTQPGMPPVAFEGAAHRLFGRTGGGNRPQVPPTRPAQPPNMQPGMPRVVLSEKIARQAPQALPMAPTPQSGQKPVSGAYYRSVDEYGRPMILRYVGGSYVVLE